MCFEFLDDGDGQAGVFLVAQGNEADLMTVFLSCVLGKAPGPRKRPGGGSHLPLPSRHSVTSCQVSGRHTPRPDGQVSSLLRFFFVGRINQSARFFLAERITLQLRFCLFSRITRDARLFREDRITPQLRLCRSTRITHVSRFFLRHRITRPARFFPSTRITHTLRFFRLSRITHHSRFCPPRRIASQSRFYRSARLTLPFLLAEDSPGIGQFGGGM